MAVARTVAAPAAKLESKLETLASQMRETLAPYQRGGVHRILPHGLEIVLQRTGDQWRLALGREGVTPSATEVQVCRAAFSVPDEAEVTVFRRFVAKQKTGRRATYQVVEMKWREVGDGQPQSTL